MIVYIVHNYILYKCLFPIIPLVIFVCVDDDIFLFFCYLRSVWRWAKKKRKPAHLACPVETVHSIRGVILEPMEGKPEGTMEANSESQAVVLKAERIGLQSGVEDVRKGLDGIVATLTSASLEAVQNAHEFAQWNQLLQKGAPAKTANKTNKGQKRTLESKNQAEAHQAQDTDIAAPAASEEGADGANGESQADPLAPESQPPRESRSRKVASFKAVATQMHQDEKTKQAMEKEKKHDSMPTTAFTRSREGFLQDLTMIYHDDYDGYHQHHQHQLPFVSPLLKYIIIRIIRFSIFSWVYLVWLFLVSCCGLGTVFTTGFNC